jgi:hypothetical protein
VQDFIDEYPGTVTPAGAQRDASLPIWVAVTHVFNLLFIPSSAGGGHARGR